MTCAERLGGTTPCAGSSVKSPLGSIECSWNGTGISDLLWISKMRDELWRGSWMITSLKLITSLERTSSGPTASPEHSMGTVLPPGVRTS